MKRSGMPRRTRPMDRGSKRLAQSELRRSGSLARHVPMKRRNAPRQREDFVRVYHSWQRRTFIASLPCAACGGIGPCQGHHIENDGAGRKAHYTKIIPLCVPCHEEWHRRGRETFQRKWHINAAAEARRTERRWQAHINRDAA